MKRRSKVNLIASNQNYKTDISTAGCHAYHTFRRSRSISPSLTRRKSQQANRHTIHLPGSNLLLALAPDLNTMPYVCRACRNTGEYVRCGDCRGSGVQKIACDDCEANDPDCEACDGKGYHKVECMWCNGLGEVPCGCRRW
jgi:hypothetical protein